MKSFSMYFLAFILVFGVIFSRIKISQQIIAAADIKIHDTLYVHDTILKENVTLIREYEKSIWNNGFLKGYLSGLEGYGKNNWKEELDKKNKEGFEYYFGRDTLVLFDSDKKQTMSIDKK